MIKHCNLQEKSSMMEVMDESSLDEELEEADKVGGLLPPIVLLNQEHLGH